MKLMSRIDKNKVCNTLRKNYPALWGIRKNLQRLKVERLGRYLLSEEEVRDGELHPDRKAAIIEPHLKKWRRLLAPVIKEMDLVIANSPVFKDLENKQDIRSDMLFCRLAYGFLPSEYAGFHFEKRSAEERKEFASDFDTNTFGYTVNDITAIQSFIDKGEGYKLSAPYYKRDAVVITNKKDYPAFEEFVQKHPEFVKKKVFSSMGKGVELVDTKAPGTDIQSLFEGMIRNGKHLLEERVIQSRELARVNPSSVNTVRCITFNTNDGIEVPYCFFKAGRNGAFVDNAGAGGIVVGVDPKTGTCFTDGFTEYGEQYANHPESGVAFKGLVLPEWESLIATCKEISAGFPKMNYLSYDLAHTDEGWVLIEVNEVGQFIIPQIVTQTGIKRELAEYMNRMPKMI